MLSSEVIKQIEDFVYSKPRSIQEIAGHIKKNWRTADRYIEGIAKDFGTINTRVFRKGTRGALKLVYWASVENRSDSVFQQRLEEEINRARKKEDFSAFDIYQHVPEKSKEVRVEYANKEDEADLSSLANLLSKAEKQLLIFSGNLSFINIKNDKYDFMKILDDLVKKGVSMKVVCRIDIVGRENIEKLLSLNYKYGKELIEVRHKEHPLRGTIIDGKIFHIKEIKEPTGKMKELNKRIFVYYIIKDREWTEWITRIFWKTFSSSISAEKRLPEMKKLIG